MMRFGASVTPAMKMPLKQPETIATVGRAAAAFIQNAPQGRRA
jgi:hypothetical protein